MRAIPKLAKIHPAIYTYIYREEVLGLVALHYKECLIEPLSMTVMFNKNKLLQTMMPKKLNTAIKKLEDLKKSNPDMAELCDKKLVGMHKRMEMFKNSKKIKQEAMEKLTVVLDSLESRLANVGQFLCGGQYSLADCLFTCVFARKLSGPIIIVIVPQSF